MKAKGTNNPERTSGAAAVHRRLNCSSIPCYIGCPPNGEGNSRIPLWIAREPARRERFLHVPRWRGLDLDRRLPLRERHGDLARQQLQRDVRARAIDRIAE